VLAVHNLSTPPSPSSSISAHGSGTHPSRCL
jgi:hypothetical protein